MPILEVEIVEPVEKPNLARLLADAAAEVLKTAAGRTWVKLRTLSLEQYAENGTTLEISPVFVSLLLGHSKNLNEKAQIALDLTTAFSRVLDRPKENIHIVFEQEGVGRIAFGGVLKTT